MTKLFFMLLFLALTFVAAGMAFAGDRQLIGAYLKGSVFVFSVLEIVMVPFVFFNISTRTLGRLFFIIVGIICAVSLLFCMYSFYRKGKRYFRNFLVGLDGTTIPLVLLIVAEAVFLCLYYHQGYYPDTYVCGIAANAYESDTLYTANPYTGAPEEGIPWRLIVSPYILAVAGVGKVLSVHPMVIFHMGIAPLALVSMYAAYYKVAALFTKNIRYRNLFLLILMGLNLLCIDFDFNPNLLMLIAPWFGKAVAVNVGLPLVWYFGLKYYGRRHYESGALLVMTLLAAFFFSVMGGVLCGMLAGCIGLYYGIRKMLDKRKGSKIV